MGKVVSINKYRLKRKNSDRKGTIRSAPVVPRGENSAQPDLFGYTTDGKRIHPDEPKQTGVSFSVDEEPGPWFGKPLR
jgi:hypothetical protein